MNTNHPSKRNILLCVTGLTPQIITETLYVLTQERKERVDEIRVITTLSGQERIMKDLLTPETGKFFEFCRDFDIDPDSIKFDRTCISILHKPDGIMLEDIRSVKDNEIAADQICEIVHELTEEPDTRIHASAAGGRKTMSVYLTAAMQLFGRTYDELSHVLVSEAFEMHPHFFYKPPIPCELEIKDRKTNEIKRISTNDAEIYLADIPFIRLRGVIPEWISNRGGNYGDWVERAQENLNFLESDYDLRIDPKEGYTISVKTRQISLTPREFFIYALFAHFRKENRGDNGFVSLNQITVEDFDRVFRYITKAQEGQEIGIEESKSFPGFEFLDILVLQKKSAYLLDQDALKNTFSQAISRIKDKIKEEDFPSRCIIENSNPRRTACYGLSILPEHIILS